MRLNPAETPVGRAERDALVLAHVDLVKSIASRLGRRLPPQVEVSELVSVGVLGLIEAATRYRPSTGVPFDAFARRRIHGAMLDALRGLDWVPRSLRKLQRKVDGTIADLRHSLGREPEGAEIAGALGVSETEYDGMLDELRSADLAAIRHIDGESGSGSAALEIAIDAEGQYARVERGELRACLARAIAGLPERERHILALYYDEELTLAEIGRVVGVGESRVSQLRSQAIARLRGTLGEWLVAPEARAS